MSKLKTRCYHLFENVLIVCCVKIKITIEKCDTFKTVGIVTVNLPTHSFPVELDADRKNQKFEKCFA